MGELTNIPMMVLYVFDTDPCDCGSPFFRWNLSSIRCFCAFPQHLPKSAPARVINPDLGLSGFSTLFSSSSIAILISLVTSQLMSTMPFPICSTTLRVLNALHKDCTANSLLGSDWENCYVDKSITIATVKMVKSRAGWPGSFHCPIPKIGENNDHSE